MLEGEPELDAAEPLARPVPVTALGIPGLHGRSAAMHKVYRLAHQIAPSGTTVLITGQTGTGKGELARALHALSPRATRPFVTVHCAGLAESLLESELFGHEKGAFTGAERRRAGRFEQASTGTIFLDEIGELAPAVQVKLLTVLQERTFERVGGNESVKVDLRIIAATHRNLAAEVAAGRFREDLFYRLNVVRIEMPMLRLRGGDVLGLAEHFLKRFALENGKKIGGFSLSAQTWINDQRWPGNVRELQNGIERAVLLCAGRQIEAEHLSDPLATVEGIATLTFPGATLAELERFAIQKTLDAVGGSTALAARALGISVRTVQNRLSEWRRAQPAACEAATG